MPRFPALLAAAAIGLLAMLPAVAAEPPAVTYAPKPPGTIVQNQLVYLAGEGMQTQWRAVASKRVVGTGNAQTFYQWYLSIYAIDGTTYHLKYRSPGNGGPLANVTQAHGAKLWFPVAQLAIVGAAELMQPGIQQLVVQTHQAAADCGSSAVTVFTTKNAKVVPAVSVSNGCDLSAKIVKVKGATAIALSGPYYGANAAMCCPTKPKASAVLRYVHGAWKESPNYFPLAVGKLPPV